MANRIREKKLQKIKQLVQDVDSFDKDHEFGFVTEDEANFYCDSFWSLVDMFEDYTGENLCS